MAPRVVFFGGCILRDNVTINKQCGRQAAAQGLAAPAMSEIDDIFASKGKGKVVSTPIPGPSTSSSKAPPKKRKKKKSNPTGPPSIKNAKDQTEGPLPSSKKRPLPETIVDTSQNVAGPSKRHKGDPEKKSKVDKAAEGEIAGFKDSRGSGSRMPFSFLCSHLHRRDFRRKNDRRRLASLQGRRTWHTR